MRTGRFTRLRCHASGLLDNSCMNNNRFFKKEEKYNGYRYVYQSQPTVRKRTPANIILI